MALTFVHSKTALVNGARKDEVMGIFCAPAHARRAQAPLPRQPRGRGHRARFNPSRDKGSFGALQGVLGLLSALEPGPSTGAVRAPRGIADGRGQLGAGLR